MYLLEAVIDKSIVDWDTTWKVIILPFIITIIVSSMIGFERQNVGKAAGLTSHMFVALAACGVAVMQRLMFEDTVKTVMEGVSIEASPTRLIAQVITGIGFVGAGVILKDSTNVIKGITTAATIFSVAMVGLIIGSGYLLVGGILAGVIIVFLYSRDLSRRFNPFISHRHDQRDDYHF